MARGQDYYYLYIAWARIKMAEMLTDIQTRREDGLEDIDTESLYEKVFALSSYINAILPGKFENLPNTTIDDIIDRIVEIAGPFETPTFSLYPAHYTGTIDESTNVSNLQGLFNVASRFTALLDTFSSYSGRANQYLLVNGSGTGLTTSGLSAVKTSYDHTSSGLSATNVQTAIDELNTDIGVQTNTVTAHAALLADIDSTGTGIMVKYANSPTTPRYDNITLTAGTSGNVSITNGSGVNGGAKANPVIDVVGSPTFTGLNVTGPALFFDSVTLTTINGIAFTAADAANLKRSGGQNTMAQNIDMAATYKVVNSVSASNPGEYTVYEQVVRTTGDQTGLDGIKEWSKPSVFQNSLIKNNVPVGLTVTVDADEQLLVGTGYSVNGTLIVNGLMIVAK